VRNDNMIANGEAGATFKPLSGRCGVGDAVCW
jgi:hypothetical protein